MKTIRNLLALSMIHIAVAGVAQKDTSKVTFSQEKVSASARLENSICEILTRREKQEKDMWKFNVLGTFLHGFDITYEKKINARPDISYLFTSMTSFSNIVTPVIQVVSGMVSILSL